jgi:hypothetical protein
MWKSMASILRIIIAISRLPIDKVYKRGVILDHQMCWLKNSIKILHNSMKQLKKSIIFKVTMRTLHRMYIDQMVLVLLENTMTAISYQILYLVRWEVLRVI